jgi:hypothetical protein
MAPLHAVDAQHLAADFSSLLRQTSQVPAPLRAA